MYSMVKSNRIFRWVLCVYDVMHVLHGYLIFPVDASFVTRHIPAVVQLDILMHSYNLH